MAFAAAVAFLAPVACSGGGGQGSSAPGSLGARRAAAADSILRLAEMPPLDSLADTTLKWLVFFGDSTIDPARSAGLRVAHQRREAEAADRERRRAAAEAPVPDRVRRIQESAARVRYEGYRQGACRPPGAARVERLVREHPDWLDEEIVSIVCEVVEGLVSSEQVALAWGRPRRVSRQGTGPEPGEVWTYDFDRVSAKKIVFVDGRRVRDAICPRTAADARAWVGSLDSLCAR